MLICEIIGRVVSSLRRDDEYPSYTELLLERDELRKEAIYLRGLVRRRERELAAARGQMAW